MIVLQRTSIFSKALKDFVCSVRAVPERGHVGYLPFQGRVVPLGVTERQRTFDACKLVNLKPVKRVTFTFDPFHPQVRSVRRTLFYLSCERVRNTNPKCAFRTEVTSDRSEPTISVALEDGGSILFKTANLKEGEILGLLNQIVLPMVKEEAPAVFESKGAKKTKGK